MPAPARVVFMGTAPLARASLAALLAAPAVAQVAAVVTQPDRPAGRDQRLQPPPVKTLAREHGLPVLQPARARDPAFHAELRALAPELLVVAAYGQILPPALLALPPSGCLNVHASLLPRWRGAAPIPWAILAGDAETGVTIMHMDEGLDTGGVVATARTPVRADDTAQTLHDRLAALGADLLVRTIPGWVAGALTARPQPAAGATYARKLLKEDGRVDWTKPAVQLARELRAFNPWPGSWTALPGPEGPVRIKLWRGEAVDHPAGAPPGAILGADAGGVLAACGSGALRLLELQREGRRRLPAREFLAGNPVIHCARFLGIREVT